MSTLGYWKTRGLAQPIRLLLNYVGEEFEEIQFVLGDGPDFSIEEWESKKNTFGLEFPNLPFYIDGDMKITQTLAIIKYLGRKYNLGGRTESEQVMVDMLLSFYMDMMQALFKVAYDANYEKLKDEMFSTVKGRYLPQLEKHLKDGNSWMVGGNVTVADFPLYEVLDQLRGINSEILQGFPKLNDFMNRIEALPPIKKYMESDKFMRTSIFNKIAGYYKKNAYTYT